MEKLGHKTLVQNVGRLLGREARGFLDLFILTSPSATQPTPSAGGSGMGRGPGPRTRTERELRGGFSVGWGLQMTILTLGLSSVFG